MLRNAILPALFIGLGSLAQSAPAWLGISVRGTSSVIIDDTFPGGPADRAGVLPGDSLLRIDDRPATWRYADSVFSGLTSGRVITLLLKRGAATRVVRVTSAPRPELRPTTGGVFVDVDSVRTLVSAFLDGARRRVQVVAPSGFSTSQSDSGLIVTAPGGRHRINIDSVVARSRRLSPDSSYLDSTSNEAVRVARARAETVHGVVVTNRPSGTRTSMPDAVLVARVLPESPLAVFGLRPLDLIVRVDDIATPRVNDLRRALSHPERVNAIVVLRHQQTVTLRR